MLPQVAFPPRRFPGFDDTPRDGFYSHNAAPSFPTQLPPLPYRHHAHSQPRASALAPRQIAYPIEPSHAMSVPQGFQHNQQPEKPLQNNTEHMLRRKTPNGTLAAGYDGTPVHWSNKPSAPKHMLLMASNAPSGQGTTYSSPAATPFTGGAPLTPGYDQRYPYQQSSGGLLQGAMVDGALNTGGDVASRAFLPPMSYGANSIVDQIQIPNMPGYSFNGIQIPTVLQPTFPQAPGPTVSNEGGYYGPPWLDSRFGNLPPSVSNYNGGMPADNYFHSFLESSNLLNGQARSVYGDFGQLQGQGLRGGPFPKVDSPGVLTPVNGQGVPSVINGTHGSEVYSNTHRQQRLSVSGNAQFKERMLLKAHSTYVDLLALLQQIRKIQRESRSTGSQYPRMSIYPKPPRLPSAAFGSQQNGIIHQHLSMNEPAFNDAGPSNLPRITGNAVGSSNYEFAQRRAALTSAAQSCLQVLRTLCEESGWCWVDGMMLGGCLFYGLDAFSLSVDWFSKIVAIEPKNVEAISNLAIALFAMNRRQEAEQHWLRAVKIRPSYFDAVEHLIGLLCADGRGHEAINIIDYVERALRISNAEDLHDQLSDASSDIERSSIDSSGAVSDPITFDFERDHKLLSPTAGFRDPVQQSTGFGSSGYAIQGSENYKILALVHAKGNLLYTLGDIGGASRAFEDAVLIAAGRRANGIQGLIQRILNAVCRDGFISSQDRQGLLPSPVPQGTPLLLPPDRALQTAKLVFARQGELPGLRFVPEGTHRKGAISTTSNSLLSLAKIFQDEMTNPTQARRMSSRPSSVSDILALYYLSLSLQPSPSTANNVGILLASVPSPSPHRPMLPRDPSVPTIPGVVPGSGVALALAYYNYGLNLDSRHAHLYTNLGSLLKDIGQLTAAIKMYEQAVDCDPTFDIALANLANAVKDQGRVKDAIKYYRRAVQANPDFAEAVCGLANALNSVCDWTGRGGVLLQNGAYDRWHVDISGMIVDARSRGATEGWMKKVVDIVGRQLSEGSNWGRGVLRSHPSVLSILLTQLQNSEADSWTDERLKFMQRTLLSWAGQRFEGARIVRLIERAVKRTMRRWYHDKYVLKKELPPSAYPRPQLPTSLSVPTAPTVLPFHTFTCPLTARDVRMISQRNALRISCQTLKSSWLPAHVYPPPPPPNPHLNIGYVSSDFNNHPLSHLMQSVFGFHDPTRAKAFCYATTASDNSIHRQQIEREAPVFRDVSNWSAEKLLHQIVQDEIHVLVNLNGYTRGARNDIFAARVAPIQMSFMGFAGTLGAEWCDYLVADETAIPKDTLRPHRGNVTLEDVTHDEEDGEWVYSENIVFTQDTFFCCDHAQSSPGSSLTWEEEQQARWQMRKELFPGLADDAIILGNFNQLYKIDPTTFRSWLRILSKSPKAILWLLRFPDLGESNLKQMAKTWGNEEIASRIWFTDVAPKQQHISRARVCDLFLDTAECNAHTTAADVLWSSTPILTLPRYRYKMCSRMAASILKGALPKSPEGVQAASELIAADDAEYEDLAVKLVRGFTYETTSLGYKQGVGRLAELRRLLYDNRWTCGLFNTRRWVGAIEDSYEQAWRRWEADEGGDIVL